MSKTTNAQKVAAIDVTRERAEDWLFKMGFSREERYYAAKGLVKYCQGIIKAEEVTHDANQS